MKNIHVACAHGRVEEYIVGILERKLGERGVILANAPGPGTLNLELSTTDSGALDSFQIEHPAAGHIRITGAGQRGLIYGIGKFLRECTFGDGTFEPCTWSGTSAPAKPVRGMYFATHFHNYYHECPIEELNRYVEDLALWGCNSIAVWFDMHHYTGIDDPEAQRMIHRLKDVLKAAKRIGLQPALTTLVNEGYSTTPQHLRSVPTPSAHYGVEICPAKPEGMELILKLRREMLEAFAEVEPEYVWIWPYDQGGCYCDDCMPWGYNGFLKSGKAEAELVRDMYPNAKTILSTWCFDYFIEGEFAGLKRAADAGEVGWADYLMIDAHEEFPKYIREHGVPGGIPALGFPEISMYKMHPWGGFGANPLPNHLQTMWDTSGHLLAGGFPYSEGNFEDINKAICLQFYWDPSKRASKTVEDYARFEFGVDPEAARDAISLMESNQDHFTAMTEVPAHNLRSTENVEECYLAVQKLAENLPEWAKHSWRWRIIDIRSKLDKAISEDPKTADPAVEALFDELTELYYAHNAEPQVSPPSFSNVRREPKS